MAAFKNCGRQQQQTKHRGHIKRLGLKPVMGIRFFLHKNGFLALQLIFYIAGMSKSIQRDNNISVHEF